MPRSRIDRKPTPEPTAAPLGAVNIEPSWHGAVWTAETIHTAERLTTVQPSWKIHIDLA